MSVSHNSCGSPDRGTPIEALSFTPTERAILNTARFYFATFAIPDGHDWLAALSTSLRFFGDDSGPHAALAILGAVQAMRRARRSAFRFNAADCPCCFNYISDHEKLFMNSLTAIAGGRPDAASGFAMLLCEGNKTDPFLQSLITVVQTCELVTKPDTALHVSNWVSPIDGPAP